MRTFCSIIVKAVFSAKRFDIMTPPDGVDAKGFAYVQAFLQT